MVYHVQTEHALGEAVQEEAGYFRVSGAYLYTVLHEVDDPLARVLLVGPFASERHNSYLPWVRWARYLAARRIEVLRYDYRGVGESTGAFEDMSFEDWMQDVQVLCDWLKRRAPERPLLIHGLELGAILAATIFCRGTGDALLLWAPPSNANEALRSTLARRVGLDQLFKYGEERRTLSDYIAQLEGGSILEVEGYPWSPRLWRESFYVTLPPGLSDKCDPVQMEGRPVKSVRLGKQAAPLVKGGSVAYDEIKDFNWLFDPNFQWISQAIALPIGGPNEEGH